MKRYTLIIGLNDKKTKNQEINTLDAYKIINNIIFGYCDGATITEATGYYKHKDGTITIEKSLQVILMFIDKKDVLEIIESCKIALNQESIVLQEENITSELR